MGAGLALAACLVVLTVVPRVLGYTTLVVQSGSMGSTAPTGSLVVAKPLPVGEVRAGDVILMKMSSQAGQARTPVMHRVVTVTERDGEVIVSTKGDANRTIDPDTHILRNSTVTPVRVVPGAGFAIGMLLSRLGWTVLVLLPAAILFWLTLNDLIESFGAQRRD